MRPENGFFARLTQDGTYCIAPIPSAAEPLLVTGQGDNRTAYFGGGKTDPPRPAEKPATAGETWVLWAIVWVAIGAMLATVAWGWLFHGMNR